MDAIQFKQDKVEEPARKWKVDIKSDVVHSIQLYREKYERYLKTVNNTANKDVWKVYDHVAEDLFNELMGQALNLAAKDMESFCEKVIIDEFQIGTS